MAFITGLPRERLTFIEDLRKNYRVCLLSNTNPFIMDWARSSRFTHEGRRLDDFFDHLFLSYQMKCVKPHRLIFQNMVHVLGSDPANILFVDDGPANIRTAEEMGYVTFMPENGTNWIPCVQNVLANSVTSRNRGR